MKRLIVLGTVADEYLHRISPPTPGTRTGTVLRDDLLAWLSYRTHSSGPAGGSSPQQTFLPHIQNPKTSSHGIA
jgi:hypothetical protein